MENYTTPKSNLIHFKGTLAIKTGKIFKNPEKQEKQITKMSNHSLKTENWQ